MHVAVGMVVLLHARVHIRIHIRIDTWVHRRVLHGIVSWRSLHGSNHCHILDRGMGLIVVSVMLVVMLWVLHVRVELLLVLVLQVLELVGQQVVVVKKVLLVSHSCGSSRGSQRTLRAVQWLLNQGTGILCSLLLAANHGEVGLWSVVVGWMDHAQDPHLTILLVVHIVAIELVGLLLHLLGLILLWRIQVGHQTVATLGSLGVSHSLSLGGILDGGSEGSRTLALEVHCLGLGRVDDNFTLLLLVEHGLDVLDQLLLGRERLDDVALAVSQHQVATGLVVERVGGHAHGVLLVGRRLHLLVQGLHLLVHLVMRLHLMMRLHLLVLQRMVLQLMVWLHVMCLHVVLGNLLHLLLLVLQSGHVQHVPVVLRLVVVVAHHVGVGEVMVGQGHGCGRIVVQLLVVLEVLLHLVLLVLLMLLVLLVLLVLLEVLKMLAVESIVGVRSRH